LGLLGVRQEKPILFRRFTTLHCLVTIAVFAVGAAFIIISATKHSAAQTACENTFFSDAGNSTSSALGDGAAEEGPILCNIFAWVTMGIMGGLWVILGLFELYLYFVISGYGSNQRDDHAQYYSLYTGNDPAGANDMLMADRSGPGDAWDSRPSTESVDTYAYGDSAHKRSDSSSTVREKAYEDPSYGRTGAYQNAPYAPSAYPPPQRQRSGSNGTYRQNTMQSQASRQMSGDDAYLSHPSNAYTTAPVPTPIYSDPYYNEQSGIGRPQPSQAHPAEGSFGRKTPRMPPPPGGPPPQRSDTFDESFFTGRR